MANNFTSKSTIEIDAPVSKVWDALVNPELIKQYLFGTEAISDWKEGSSITYKGVWEGKTYEDKGKILEIKPEKLLVSTYWSSMSGLTDSPDNYNKVTYELSGNDEKTTLSISQDNIDTEESRDHSKKNWDTVLQSLKSILEK